MIEIMFYLLKNCFFIGYDFEKMKRRIITEEEEIYLREQNEIK